MRLRSATAANPNAGGTFAEVPLSNALLYIRDKRLSGVLDLRAPGGRHGWIVTWRGRVVTATTTPPVARFGAIAYELGLIDAETLETSATFSESHQRPHAEVLLDSGAISHAQLRRILEEQTSRRVQHMFTYSPDTIFLFREGSPSSMEPQITVDLIAPVWRGLSEHPPRERIEKMMAAIGHRPLQPVAEKSVERADFSRTEAALVEQLAHGAMTLETMKATTRMSAERVELLAYMLVLSRGADVIGQGNAVAPSSAMWAAVKPRPTPTTSGTVATGIHVRGPRELGADAIRARAATVKDESPAQVLGLESPEGLEKSVSAEAARAAFFRLSRVWHPDKLPPELEDVRDQVTQIYERMADACHLFVQGEVHSSTR